MSNIFSYKVSDIYGDNKFKKNITIKHACYNAASRYVEEIRGYNRNTEAMPDNDRQNMIAAFDEAKSDDYSKVDETIAKMKLTNKELETLNCYMSGMAFVETAKWLSVNLSTIWRRRASIQKKYLQNVGAYL